MHKTRIPEEIMRVMFELWLAELAEMMDLANLRYEEWFVGE